MPASTAITTQSASATIGSTAAVVVYGNLSSNTRYLAIYNVAPVGGQAIWISRLGTAAVNGPGSIPIEPQNGQVFVYPGPIPTNSLSAISTGAGAPLTVEYG